MNGKLQDAYNEWLLLYGFRLVHRSDMCFIGDGLLSLILSSSAKNVLKVRMSHRRGKPYKMYYQLKTPEELTEEQNADINQTRTTTATKETRSANPCA